MPPTLAIVIAATVLVFQAVSIRAAQGPATPTEAGLEAEFRQLRAKLGSMPEFSGADAASKYRLAEELARRGDMRGAIDMYRAAIHLNREWADPYRGLGQVLLDHHEYAEAVQALQAGIRFGREEFQVFHWLGRAYMGKGDLPAAAAALVRATELEPEDAEAFADLGLVRMAQGDAVGAEAALTQSIRLKPDYAEAHQLRDQLTKVKGDPEQTRQAGQALFKNLFGRE